MYKDVAKRILAAILIFCMIGSTPNLTLLAGTEEGNVGAEHTYAYGSTNLVTTNNFIGDGEWFANAYAVEANADSTKNVQVLQSVAFALDRSAQYGDGAQHIKTADYVVDIFKYESTDDISTVLGSKTPEISIKGTYNVDDCTDGTYYTVSLADEDKEVVLGKGENFAVKITLSNAYSQKDGSTESNRIDNIYFESSSDSSAESYVNGERLSGRTAHIKAVTTENFEEIPIEGMQFSESSTSMIAGEEKAIQVEYTPATTSQTELIWSSDKEEVATVDNGNVTAVAPGYAKITAVSAVDSSISDTMEIEVCKDIAELTYSVIADQTYQGTALEPTFEVRDGDVLLSREAGDYIAVYSNNTDVGTATVKVTADGNGYKGEKSVSFNIVPVDLANGTVTASCSAVYDYTGEEVRLTDPGTEISVIYTNKEGTSFPLTYAEDGSADFKIQKYQNNIAAGNQACVVLEGTGNYSGTLDCYFQINAAMDTITASADTPIFTYDGKAHKSDVTVMDGATELKKGTDYTVTYPEDVINAGKKTVEIQGLGAYAAYSKEVSYTISARRLTNGVTFADLPNQVSPVDKDSLKGLSLTYQGKELIPDTDYTITVTEENGSVTVTLNGINNFQGKVEQTVSTGIDIASCTVTVETATYTGDALEPKVTVKTTADEVVEVDNYTLKWSNNVDAGVDTASVTVSGINNYAGEVTKNFTINQKDISEVGITYISPVTYQKPENPENPGIISEPSLTWNGRKLKKGTDYTVAFSDNTAVTGKAKMAITGNGNYTGSTDRYYSISIADLSGDDMTYEGVLEKYDYTGAAIEPEVIIKQNGVELKKGTDYEVTYSGNVKVGTGYIFVKGLNNYAGTEKEITFEITEVGIAGAVVEAILDQEYTGSEIKPDLTVKVDGTVLTAGTDYDVVYADNIEAGEATVTLTGKNNYSGTKTVSFKIIKDIRTNDGTIQVAEILPQYYAGAEVCPEVVITDSYQDGTVHTLEADEYTVSYKDNDDIGTATVTITGKKYYKETVTVSFVINKGNLGETNELVKAVLVNANQNARRFTGSPITPEIKVTCSGNVLSNPADYTIDYFYNTNVTNSGATKVRINGTGKFEGTRTVYFDIIPKDISYDAAISVEVEDIDALVLETQEYPEITVKDLDRDSISGEKLSAGGTGGFKLTQGEAKDYTLGKVTVNIDGSATVEIIGQNNYSGTLTVPFTVNKTDIGNVTFESVLPEEQKSFVYTGDVVVPEPVVTMTVDGIETVLEEGTDYTVSADAVNVGIGYNYTLEFIGKYSGTYVGKDTFAITEKNIKEEDVTVDEIPNQAYTGSELTPSVTVRYNGKIIDSSNYTLSYTNNVESGTNAIVTITGQKNFTGSREETFQIRQSIDADISVTGLEKAFVYTSQEICPEVVVTSNGKTLLNGVDYTLSYENNINANDREGMGPAYVIVNGAGEYGGVKKFPFKISKKNMLDDDVDITVEDAVFTGGTIQPKVKIVYTLPDGSQYILKDLATVGPMRDYDASVGSSSEAGEEVTVTITPSGINFYSEYGTFTKKFRILPKELLNSDKELASDYTISCPAEVQYDADTTVYEPEVVLKDKTRSSDGTPQTSGTSFYKLVKGKDYTITYTNNTRPGKASYTIEGKGNYSGTYTGSFTILADLKDATVVIKDQTYTGDPITPSFTVSFGDMQLRNEVDYIYEFSNNTNAGEAVLKIIGTGSYAGSQKEQKFKILPKPIGDEDVVMTHVYGSYSYTGKDVHPDPHFTYNNRKLALGTDFTCIYEEGCSKAGKWYSFTVNGIGNFTGSLNKEYKIGDNYTDSTVNITLSGYSFEYTGKPIQPMVSVALIESPYTTLKQNIDYQFEYEDNVDVGTAYVNTWGDPNNGIYAGNVSAAFEITPKSIRDDDVVIAAVADTVYTREAIEPTPSVTWNGVELIAGEDFTYSYKNNTDAGTAAVTIEGIGNFTDTKTVEFEILRKDISEAASGITVENIPDQIYTGNPAEPKPEITWGETVLDSRSDYTLTYEDNVELGEAVITIEGTGNYTGTLIRKFNIIKVPVERMEVEYQKVWQYTGNSIEPPVKITYEDDNGNRIQLDNSEFTITYKNTVDSGEGTEETGVITIIGNGNYEGTKKCFYTIEQRQLTDVTVTMDKIPSQVLDGENKAEPKPVIVFRPDSKTTYTLVEGIDYEVSYSNNTTVGDNGKITVTGLHNFAGTLSQEFYIGKDITQYFDSIEFVEEPDYFYNGKAHTPEIQVNLKEGVSADLVEGRDYEVLYDGQKKETIEDDAYATKAGLHKVAVNGLDPYGGRMEMTYEIFKRDISKVNFEIADQSYTGSEIHPFIMGIDVGANTTLGEDTSTAVVSGDISREDMLANKNAFTTSYEGNCTDIGTVTVELTATDASNYTGSTTIQFNIVPKDLAGDGISCSTVTKQEYTGKEIKPGIEITDMQRNPEGEAFDAADDTEYYTLVEGTDYDITYTDNIYPGVVTMTITGKNHYTGSLTKKFEITADLSNAVIAPIPAQIYQDGTPVTPELTVTLGERTLIENFDYTVTYSNNTGRGTATATIYPVAGSMYTGSQSVTFEISRELTADTVTLMMIDTSFSYTGSAITPEVGVIYGENQRLTEGVDYTVTYENNVNVGVATIIITGTGVFSGIVSVNFTIIKRSIIRCNFNNVSERLYNGNATDQSPVVMDGNYVLTLGQDYTVTYANNTQPGIATMTISGIGNYAGTKTIRYLINVKDMTQVKASSTSSSVKLSWTKVDGAGGYAIYTADNQLIAKTTATSYQHKNLKAVKTYTYKVRPYVVSDGATYYGNFSNTISIMTKPSKPSVKLTAGTGQVKVKWKKISGVSGYVIYRSTKKSSGYKKIKTIKKASTTSYTNKKLSRKKKYYYKVRAYKVVDGKKVYGSYSSVKSIKTK